MPDHLPSFSIVLPVYNRLQYLTTAVESVISQTYRDWNLWISDDNSDLPTKLYLEQIKHPQIQIQFNPHNLGLFANLNQAIRLSDRPYILLLCSDDYLLPDGLAQLAEKIKRYREAGLLLSAFKMIDGHDQEITSGSEFYNQQLTRGQTERLLSPQDSLPLLLKFGSINGNLTGMCFKRSLFIEIGEFRCDWRHAADWEWVYRACATTEVLISNQAIASVREHPTQLSATNFYNISNSLEVIAMVGMLLHHPINQKIPQAKTWALHILQFHLWFSLKFWRQGETAKAKQIIQAIAQIMPLSAVTWQMLKWLPTRLQVALGMIDFSSPPD